MSALTRTLAAWQPMRRRARARERLHARLRMLACACSVSPCPYLSFRGCTPRKDKYVTYLSFRKDKYVTYLSLRKDKYVTERQVRANAAQHELFGHLNERFSDC
eukprot:6184286-Pleurochrysis_carterae.AAC.1